MFELEKKNKFKNLPNEIGELISKSDVISKIATRASDPNENLGQLKTFTENSLQRIADFMPVINEKNNVFGRQNSFHNNKLMTLQMLTKGSPMRTLKQCLAQIERKRGAIKETLIKLKKQKIESEEILDEIIDINDEMEIVQKKINEIEKDNRYVLDAIDNPLNENLKINKKELRKLEYQKKYKEIDLEEIISNIADVKIYLEGAFKEIASFQEAYKQILKNKNIPEDWDEITFESMESRFNVRHAFSNGYRDIKAHGNLGMGTMEHLNQFGIHPDQAELEIRKYLGNVQNKLYKKIIDEEGKTIIINDSSIDYNNFENWLDEMQEKYADNYKNAMEYMGLDSISDEWYSYHSNKFK